MIISSLIRQKWQSQSRCFKKAKRVKFSEKQTFSYTLIRRRTFTHTFALLTTKCVKLQSHKECFKTPESESKKDILNQVFLEDFLLTLISSN